MTFKLPPILAFAPHPWWNHWLSRQQLLSRLGTRGWPVTYSFGPLNVWYRHAPLWQESDWRGRIQKEDHVQIDRPGRLPPLWPKFPLWDHLTIRHHAHRMKVALGEHRHDPNLIVLLFHPTFQPWLQWLKPAHLAYHVYDAYAMMETWTPAKAEMERRVIEQADLITTSSSGMASSLPWGGAAKAHVLNNGADAQRFLSHHSPPCPADLAQIPHPRIGYVGSINPKLDLEMVLTLAAQRPEWHWVFIGPVYMQGLTARDKTSREQWSQCLERPNIHWLSRKTGAEMPAYLNHMDIHTICYKIATNRHGVENDWVVHGYPTKLHECLATGLPVVAAAQQVIVDEFQHVVAVAHTHEEWERAIDNALNSGGTGTPQARQATALANTWDSRVDMLESWLKEMILKPRCPDRF